MFKLISLFLHLLENDTGTIIHPHPNLHSETSPPYPHITCLNRQPSMCQSSRLLIDSMLLYMFTSTSCVLHVIVLIQYCPTHCSHYHAITPQKPPITTVILHFPSTVVMTTLAVVMQR